MTTSPLDTHPHVNGTKVRVYNGFETLKDGSPLMDGGNPVPKLEGYATITSPIKGVEDRYRVRFPGEKKTYERFVEKDAAVIP
jgi:hypothetical protein